MPSAETTLFTHSDSLHTNINLTKEEEVNVLIHMLDVDIQRKRDSTLSSDVFRKPTRSNQ